MKHIYHIEFSTLPADEEFFGDPEDKELIDDCVACGSEIHQMSCQELLTEFHRLMIKEKIPTVLSGIIELSLLEDGKRNGT